MRLAGIAAAVLLCIGGALQFYNAESDFQDHHRDQFLISSQAATYAPMVGHLNGPVGYITDAQPGTEADASLFLSAQYLMAPVLLVKGENSGFVIGNFGKPADFEAIGRARGLRVAHDYGDGLILYQRLP
jgi:hypothetical protein